MHISAPNLHNLVGCTNRPRTVPLYPLLRPLPSLVHNLQCTMAFCLLQACSVLQSAASEISTPMSKSPHTGHAQTLPSICKFRNKYSFARLPTLTNCNTEPSPTYLHPECNHPRRSSRFALQLRAPAGQVRLPHQHCSTTQCAFMLPSSLNLTSWLDSVQPLAHATMHPRDLTSFQRSDSNRFRRTPS